MEWKEKKRRRGVRALTLIARMLGRKRGVAVIFDPGASTAFTDSKTITLPEFNDLGEEDDAALVNGLIDHEACHCRFTDFTLRPPELKWQIMKSISNIIEDVWIEREQAKLYPGCWINIVASIEVMIGRKMYDFPEKEREHNAATAAVNYLLHYMLGRHYGMSSLQAMAAGWGVLMQKHFGKPVLEQVTQLSHEVDMIATTAAAHELAKKIINVLGEALAKSPSGESLKEMVLSAADQQTDRGGRILSCMPAAVGVSVEKEATNSIKPRPRDGSPIQEAAEVMARQVASGLARQFDVFLRTKVDDGVLFARSGGRLASRRLPGIRTGKTSVFARTDIAEGLSTTVTAVVDASGSMMHTGPEGKHPKMVYALAGAIALQEVLERYHVPSSMITFGGQIIQTKSFTTPWKQARDLDLDFCLGGTFIGPALVRSIHQLIGRREARHLVLLISDGDGGPDDESFIRSLGQEMRDSMPSLDLAGIFIGADGEQTERALEVSGRQTSRVQGEEDLVKAIFSAATSAF